MSGTTAVAGLELVIPVTEPAILSTGETTCASAATSARHVTWTWEALLERALDK